MLAKLGLDDPKKPAAVADAEKIHPLRENPLPMAMKKKPAASRPPAPGEADPHFGSDEQMLAWATREGITPRKDSRGNWDWPTAWEEYLTRPEPEIDHE